MKRAILNLTAALTVLFTLFAAGVMAQGKFVYTNNNRKDNNSVSGFKVNPNGSIELLPGMPVGAGGGGADPDLARPSSCQIVVVEKGPYLYAVNSDDQNVAGWRIDPNTGALTFIGSIDLGGGNVDDCSFTVKVFDVRLQDEGTPSRVILFNTFTGEYRLCAPGVPGSPFTGVGTVSKIGCNATLEHNTPDRRLLAKVTPSVKTGLVSFQSPPGVVVCSITDKNIFNNTSLCP